MKLADYGVVELNDFGIPYDVHFLTEMVHDHTEVCEAISELLAFYLDLNKFSVEIDEEYIENTLIHFPIHVHNKAVSS